MKNKNSISYVVILIIIVLIISVFIAIGISYNMDEKAKTNDQNEMYLTTVSYSYNEQLSKEKDHLLRSYDDYQSFIKKYDLESKLQKKDFNTNEYLIAVLENDYCGGHVEGIKDVIIDESKIKVTVMMYASCGFCAPSYEIFLIPITKDKIKELYDVEYAYEHVNDLKCDSNISYKPIIYLYPTKEMAVNIKLGKPDKITSSYPKYQDSWRVIAKPTGELIDTQTNHHLYGLYWEGINDVSNPNLKIGFVVEGSETISFLEEKLALLGLTEREANEFIIYWLPQLEHNKYNYIYFESLATTNNNMPLEIEPEPDTLIRVNMLWKKLDEKITVTEQLLTTPQRQGFTVVEWGGTELK